MDIESYRNYCLRKKGVTEDFPFDNETLVYKVGGKIFALTNIDLFDSINMKCDPIRALELRERYDAIIPGFHMNKRHWNTVKIDGTLPDTLILEMIDHSYTLVLNGLPRFIKENL
jgi:predicted DNA-binding protein (MmcQ/YjbR family)